MGLDLGSVRIGVAVSTWGRLAVPSTTLRRGASWDRPRRDSAARVRAGGRGRGGRPAPVDGRDRGPLQPDARREVRGCGGALEVPVETYDERLTTVAANRSLAGAGLSSAASRRHVDEVAATVILQSWLDHRREQADTRGDPT
ncbi:MAG: Holliday junction resolvase RuvX [Microthrixaceae bacterium]